VRVTLLVEALRPPLSGIGRYTWELCQRVPRQPGIDEVDFYGWGRFIEDPADIVTGDPLPKRRSMARWLPRRLRKRESLLGLVHGPNYFLPRLAETGIVTIHDLSVLRFPETHPPERLRAFEQDFESSISRASHILTDTQTVREEMITTLGVAPERVTAVHLGVDSRYHPRNDEETAPLLRQWGLKPGAYGLGVSTLEPRKKILELLRAWQSLPAATREAFPLVLAGAKGWLNDEIHRQIDQGVAAGWLKFLGFVADDELAALYAGAALFLYPSIYEGFGLPPVEAMASGVPVIVARSSCLPEVCGPAARYVDPDDLTALTDAILESLEDEQWQSAARMEGLRVAGRYSWERCAAETVAVYHRNQGAAGLPDVLR
jgi:glycosyltransferase involved in cell wall biosynthesis